MSQIVARAQREGGQHVEDAIDQVPVDPADQPRESQDEPAVETGVDGVEPVPAARKVVERREHGRDPSGIDRAALVHRPGEHEAGHGQSDRERRKPRRRLLVGLGAAEGEADADEHREGGEEPERPPHQPGRFVRMAARVRPSEERDEDHAKHVEGRQQRGQRQHQERAHQVRLPHAAEHRFLGVEARERRHPGQREGPDHEDDCRLWHRPEQPAHPEDVVRADGVDHRTGGEEQERLEEAVREQVQEAGARRAGARGGHHVSELRDRRVREHALDVALDARHRRG